MDKLLTLLLWISLLSFLAQAKFKTLHCQTHDESIGNFSMCGIKAVSRSRNLINIIFNMRQTLGGGVTAQVQFLKRANGWKPFLYQFKVDVCQFFRKPQHLIGSIAFTYLKPFTNINHTCPYMANSSIIVKNFELDVDKIRARFPIDNGEYGLALGLFLNNVLKVNINGSINFLDYKEH